MTRKALNVWISEEADRQLRKLAAETNTPLNRIVEASILIYKPQQSVIINDDKELFESRLAELHSLIEDLTSRVTTLETTKPETVKPETVEQDHTARDALAKELRDKNLPMRTIADELAGQGFVTSKGTKYGPAAISKMIESFATTTEI